jgi:acyl-CoA-binding protein
MSTSSPSIDRVFAHALQTVRKIPRTGSSRPPPEARLKLYGLYKQSMEGDVTHVMPRPPDPVPPDVDIAPDENLRAEIEKWDAWYAQRGISKTEAKRRYISTLIEVCGAFLAICARWSSGTSGNVRRSQTTPVMENPTLSAGMWGSLRKLLESRGSSCLISRRVSSYGPKLVKLVPDARANVEMLQGGFRELHSRRAYVPASFNLPIPQTTNSSDKSRSETDIM